MAAATMPPRVAAALARVRKHARRAGARAVMLLVDVPTLPACEQEQILFEVVRQQRLNLVSITSRAGGALEVLHAGAADVVVVFLADGAFRQLVTDAGGRVVTAVDAAGIRAVHRDEVGTTPQLRPICDADEPAAADDGEHPPVQVPASVTAGRRRIRPLPRL